MSFANSGVGVRDGSVVDRVGGTGNGLACDIEFMRKGRAGRRVSDAGGECRHGAERSFGFRGSSEVYATFLSDK
jgi:hypothetical protein